MKKTMLLMASTALIFSACENAPKADHAHAQEAQATEVHDHASKMPIDIAQTKIEFIGTKPTSKHHGTIGLKESYFMIDHNAIVGGLVTIDMNTLKADDQDEESNAKLSAHLMNEDFFDVPKYPTAQFEITKVAEGLDSTQKDIIMKDATHTVSGNLTMKGVTKHISFPAKINQNENGITADANFNINRTDWGLTYKSDASLGDKIIHPTVNIGFHLVAKP